LKVKKKNFVFAEYWLSLPAMKLKKFSKLRLSVPSAPKKQVVKVVTTFFVDDDVVDVDDDVADVEVVDVDVADVEAFRTRLARGPPAS